MRVSRRYIENSRPSTENFSTSEPSVRRKPNLLHVSIGIQPPNRHRKTFGPRPSVIPIQWMPRIGHEVIGQDQISSFERVILWSKELAPLERHNDSVGLAVRVIRDRCVALFLLGSKD